MSMPRKTPKRPSDGRKRRRADPAGMSWRNGRPIWIPGPRLRDAGWKSIALKSAEGEYLPRGLARIMAREIGEDVERWRKDPERRDLHYTPGERRPPKPVEGLSDETLANAAQRMFAHDTFRTLAPKTREGYKSDLERFLRWAGGCTPLVVDRKAFRAFIALEWDRIFAERQLGIPERELANRPTVTGPDGSSYAPDVRDARFSALDDARNVGNIAGQSQVAGVVRAVSRLYSFIETELEWIPAGGNPAAKFGLRAIKPNLRMPSDDELAHLVEISDAAGMPSVGDAIILEASLAPRPADLVGWTMDILAQGYVAGTISKTGARVEVKLPAAVRRRATMIHERRAQWAADNPRARIAPQILLTTARRIPYTSDTLSREFSKVRALAAQDMPSVLDLTPYSFKNMGITRLSMAGNSRDAICAVTRHSHDLIASVLDHYIVPTREAADAAVDRMDAYLAEKGVKW